ncbi:MAG: hypothetical protein QG597_1896 [Actinomycetota bacterium]|nr:hypothetical protein [Actinomycetota bacterium]
MSGQRSAETVAAIDRGLVGDRSIWAALFDGEFRLAVPCSRCGRWLTSAASKKHRLGSRCAARAGNR